MSLQNSAVRGGAQLRNRVTAAINAAVLDELADHGYGAFSMNSVAHRAGVGKAALYRRWRSKEPMVVEVVAPFATVNAEPPNTGSLDGDLRSLLAGLRDVLAQPRVARIATDLFAESLRSSDRLIRHAGKARCAPLLAVLSRTSVPEMIQAPQYLGFS